MTQSWTIRPEDRVALLDPPRKPIRRLPPEQAAKIRRDVDLLASPDEKLAWQAVSRLGRRRGKVVEFLAAATADPSADVRHLAVHALERIGDPRVGRVIVEMIKDPCLDNRWCACAALGRIWKERAIPILVSVILRTDPEDEGGSAQQGACEGLAAIGAPAIPAVVEVLEGGDADARMYAAWILRRIADETVIAPLSRLLSDRDTDMRVAGVENLAILGEDYLADFGDRCLGLIEPLQSDKDAKVRDIAAYWSEELGKMMPDQRPNS